MQISVTELRRLASDVDDAHHDGMRSFREEAADVHRDLARGARRSFLKKAGLAGAGGALLAAGPFGSFTGLLPAGAQELDDETIAGYAASVELAAVEAYRAAAAALSAEVKPVGELFASHHQQHADAFNQVAGDKAASAPNEKLVAAVTPQLQAITDQTGALEFARVLENQAAYTYAAALTLLADAAYASATATILPIEAMHATVLTIALGNPTPDRLFPTGAFESTTLGDGTDDKAGLDPATFA